MKKAVWVGAIIVVLVVAGVFLLQGGLTGDADVISDANKNENSNTNEKVKEFNINAFKFGYSPNLIEATKGDKVRIKINNTDVLHGIRIPELNIKGNEIIEFTADKSGEFVWYCANFCGEGHREMKGKLVVK